MDNLLFNTIWSFGVTNCRRQRAIKLGKMQAGCSNEVDDVCLSSPVKPGGFTDFAILLNDKIVDMERVQFGALRWKL